MNTQRPAPAALGPARYTFGGDEFLFVEISPEMSLQANFRAMLIAGGIRERKIEGVVELCPANASLLVRFNPDVIKPDDLKTQVEEIEESVISRDSAVMDSRIIEVPVWFDDPITAEVVSRFREGYHQEPSGNDLDYAANLNGFDDPAEFIKAYHSNPWIVSMVGFVAGLPFMYQLVDRDQQLEVPKYLSPRTDTAKLTVGHGGCFSVIYSVQGGGGYQMFGIAAGPIFDPSQDVSDDMILFRPGDIVKFKSIDGDEYNRLQEQVEAGTFSYRITPIQFDMQRALDEGSAYNAELMEALNES